MYFKFEVGRQEKHSVEFYRNQLWGTMHISVDGKKVREEFDVMSLSLTTEYEIDVGVTECHKVRVENVRPFLLAGFRPHQYSLFIDGEKEKEYRGF